MKKIYFIICFSITILYNPLKAQNFHASKIEADGALKSLQKQLYDWADTADVAKAHYWKYIKRWENELSKRTASDGEPGDARELINYKQQRSNAKSSSAFSADWYPVGPDFIPDNYTYYLENGIGRINCMAFHPTDAQTFYVGVAQGGLWKTTNGGQSWIPLTDELPITRISAIAIDPINPDVIYISLCDFEYIGFGLELNDRKRYPHYGLGVFKSTDGGLSWVQTSLNYDLTDYDASLIREIKIHPENTNTLVACGTSGMFRSEDAGANWTAVLDTLFWDLVSDPSDADVLYAASGWVNSSNAGYAAIYKSNDFGQSWTLLPTGIPPQGQVQRIKLSVSESNPNFIYALAVDVFGGLYTIYKSTNGGNTWQEMPQELNVLDGFEGFDVGGQGTYDLVLHVDRFNPDKIYVGGINLWMSNDGAASFNPVSHWTIYYGETIHADMHYLTQHPLTDEYFICNDGGIYKTDLILSQTWDDANSGFVWPSTWENISNGMQITSFYRLSSSKTNDGRLIAGAQDNATFYYNGESWRTIFGGDGMDNLLIPTDDQIVIGAAQFGYIYQSTDGAFEQFNNFSANDGAEDADWTAPIIGCADGSGRIFAGFQNVWEATNDGAFWFWTGPLESLGEPICALAASPQDCDVLYAATKISYVNNAPAQFFKSDNGGGTWQNRTFGLPDSLYFSSIDVSPLNENHVVVSIAGFSSGKKVYRSIDGGLNWENITYNLGNFPANMLKFLPQSNHLLVATDAGIFYLEDGSDSWTDESTGLPNAIVSDIEINTAANTVYISTFGRGIWASDLNLILNNKQAKACDEKLSFARKSAELWSIGFEGDCHNNYNHLDIVDVMGKTVFSTDVKSMQVDFSLSGKASGVYFARLSGKSGAVVQKFVKD
jgi:photosystem II stability/assembly factor-like uncharacterized protein